MTIRTNCDPVGELLTVPQAQAMTNLGKNTILALSRESGAARKIGRSYRIKKDILLDYIEKNCKAE